MYKGMERHDEFRIIYLKLLFTLKVKLVISNIPGIFPEINSTRNYLQYWQVKSSLWAQNGPLLSLKADDDPRMSLQFPTITYFTGTEEGGHLWSKTEEGRFGTVRPQENFSLASIVNVCNFK
jgi:hypothetical protein